MDVHVHSASPVYYDHVRRQRWTPQSRGGRSAKVGGEQPGGYPIVGRTLAPINSGPVADSSSAFDTAAIDERTRVDGDGAESAAPEARLIGIETSPNVVASTFGELRDSATHAAPLREAALTRIRHTDGRSRCLLQPRQRGNAPRRGAACMLSCGCAAIVALKPALFYVYSQ